MHVGDRRRVLDDIGITTECERQGAWLALALEARPFHIVVNVFEFVDTTDGDDALDVLLAATLGLQPGWIDGQQRCQMSAGGMAANEDARGIAAVVRNVLAG